MPSRREIPVPPKAFPCIGEGGPLAVDEVVVSGRSSPHPSRVRSTPSFPTRQVLRGPRLNRYCRSQFGNILRRTRVASLTLGRLRRLGTVNGRGAIIKREITAKSLLSRMPDAVFGSQKPSPSWPPCLKGAVIFAKNDWGIQSPQTCGAVIVHAC